MGYWWLFSTLKQLSGSNSGLSHWPHSDFFSLWQNHFHHNGTALVFRRKRWQEASQKTMTITETRLPWCTKQTLPRDSCLGHCPRGYSSVLITQQGSLWDKHVSRGRKCDCPINKSRGRSEGRCVSCQRPPESQSRWKVSSFLPHTALSSLCLPPCPSELSIRRVIYFVIPAWVCLPAGILISSYSGSFQRYCDQLRSFFPLQQFDFQSFCARKTVF